MTTTPGHLPAAVLFDWDGTLADTLPMIYRANVAALGTYGIELSREWFRERYTPDWRRSYRELGVPEHLWDELAGRWAAEMQRMRPRALPWARGAIRRLRRHGVRVGLVTASLRGVVEPGIRRLHLADAFEVAWFSDDVAQTKPHPEALLRALEQLGVAPRDSIYVGDSTVDLEMARAAGAAFAAVGTTTPAAVFHAAGIDHVWPSVGAWADALLAGPVAPGGRGADDGGEPRGSG